MSMASIDVSETVKAMNVDNSLHFDFVDYFHDHENLVFNPYDQLKISNGRQVCNILYRHFYASFQ